LFEVVEAQAISPLLKNRSLSQREQLHLLEPVRTPLSKLRAMRFSGAFILAFEKQACLG